MEIVSSGLNRRQLKNTCPGIYIRIKAGLRSLGSAPGFGPSELQPLFQDACKS
jgi:hypothetical protein